MTKPTTTTNPTDTIAQVLALQSRRISTMEATLRRIETRLEQSDPKHSRKEA
ncbi:hypothetical protein [Brevibacterium casei]|uniref:hypothetical protein n=1 Tax=Brevibacterium casei TaxID=33889 RepID=UPI003EEB1E8B